MNMEGKIVLPSGIAAIRQHVKEVDNIPLQVRDGHVSISRSSCGAHSGHSYELPYVTRLAGSREGTGVEAWPGRKHLADLRAIFLKK